MERGRAIPRPKPIYRVRVDCFCNGCLRAHLWRPCNHKRYASLHRSTVTLHDPARNQDTTGQLLVHEIPVCCTCTISTCPEITYYTPFETLSLAHRGHAHDDPGQHDKDGFTNCACYNIGGAFSKAWKYRKVEGNGLRTANTSPVTATTGCWASAVSDTHPPRIRCKPEHPRPHRS